MDRSTRSTVRRNSGEFEDHSRRFIPADANKDFVCWYSWVAAETHVVPVMRLSSLCGIKFSWVQWES